MRDILKPYVEILNRFVDNEITAGQFERDYLALFMNETTKIGGDEFSILDGIFAEVEEYTSDPELRERVGGYDDNELHMRVKKLRDRLLALVT